MAREVVVSRPEDVCLALRSDYAKELKRKGGGGGGGGGGGKASAAKDKRVQREVALSIGGDLAFSDEEDDDDDEGEGAGDDAA